MRRVCGRLWSARTRCWSTHTLYIHNQHCVTPSSSSPPSPTLAPGFPFTLTAGEHQIECQVSGGDHLLVLRILKASDLDTSVWTFGLPSPFVRARIRCPETAGGASGTGKTIDRCGEEDPVQTNTKATTVNPVVRVRLRLELLRFDPSLHPYTLFDRCTPCSTPC